MAVYGQFLATVVTCSTSALADRAGAWILFEHLRASATKDGKLGLGLATNVPAFNAL